MPSATCGSSFLHSFGTICARGGRFSTHVSQESRARVHNRVWIEYRYRTTRNRGAHTRKNQHRTSTQPTHDAQYRLYTNVMSAVDASQRLRASCRAHCCIVLSSFNYGFQEQDPGRTAMDSGPTCWFRVLLLAHFERHSLVDQIQMTRNSTDRTLRVPAVHQNNHHLQQQRKQQAKRFFFSAGLDGCVSFFRLFPARCCRFLYSMIAQRR